MTLASTKTVGTLGFDSPQSYTLTGSQLVIDNGANPGAINVTAGSHVIAAPLQLNANTTVTVTPDGTNSSRLTLTGALTTGTGVTLTKAGAGPMDVSVLRIPALAVTGGTIRVLPNGGTTGTSRLTTLSVTGGNLDLADNDLVIDYSGATPADTVRQYLLAGRNGGAWTGTGVVSSTAAADVQQRTAIASVEASALLGLSGAATATGRGRRWTRRACC